MFNRIPLVVKNIIIINVLVFLACQVMPGLYNVLGGHYYLSEHFGPWQLVTHMFMHAELPHIEHIFFNMYGLYIFGSMLEQVWGPKRFLTFYMVSGLGAFFLHMLINHFEVQALSEKIGPEKLHEVLTNGMQVIESGKYYTDQAMHQLNMGINGVIVGASGCVFGVLLAFGLLFPNVELMLLFPPIPIKAKWFVFGYGAIEFYFAMRNAPGDNVAHYAHIGGMLFGYILLKIWQSRGIKLN